jgi:hypothetical protein
MAVFTSGFKENRSKVLLGVPNPCMSFNDWSCLFADNNGEAKADR